MNKASYDAVKQLSPHAASPDAIRRLFIHDVKLTLVTSSWWRQTMLHVTEPESDGVNDVQRRGPVLLRWRPALRVQVAEDHLERIIVVVVGGSAGPEMSSHHLVYHGVSR